jgi:predicted GIY-YIG superfamily endonuclease
MTKYSIYKLTCETGRVYVGITTGYLSKRLWKHKYDPSNGTMSKDFINPTIELLEELETDDKEEKKIKERFWMEQFDNCVNKRKEYLTPEEKKERKREIDRRYRLKNKEKIKESNKKWYEKKLKKNVINE